MLVLRAFYRLLGQGEQGWDEEGQKVVAYLVPFCSLTEMRDTENANGLNSIREDFKRKLMKRLDELNTLLSTYQREKEETMMFLTRMELSPISSHRPTIISKLPFKQFILEAIDNEESEFTIKKITHELRKKFSEEQVSSPAIRRVLSKLARRKDSPLQLVRAGIGSEPNVYKKLRPVAGERDAGSRL
jgi:hypothetical protein